MEDSHELPLFVNTELRIIYVMNIIVNKELRIMYVMNIIVNKS